MRKPDLMESCMRKPTWWIFFIREEFKRETRGEGFALKKGETKNTEQVDKKEKRDQRVDWVVKDDDERI